MSTTHVIDLATRIQRRRDFAAHLSGFLCGAVVLSALFAAGVDPAIQLAVAVLTWGSALSFQHFRHVIRGPVTPADVTAEHDRLTRRPHGPETQKEHQCAS